jgi:hypothetical protein
MRFDNAKLDEDDRDRLAKLVARRNELEEADDEKAVYIPAAFVDMLARDRALSFKQRAWVRAVYEKTFDEPMYENLASSGTLCRGREVETPAVLRHLPKKPPQRRTTDG